VRRELQNIDAVGLEKLAAVGVLRLACFVGAPGRSPRCQLKIHPV
jgi:hypothetical protein